MTHLGEYKLTLSEKEVSIKFGMLFWKLLLAHYNKPFNELGSLLQEKMTDTVFMLDIVLYGHKSYCELNSLEQAFNDDLLIELCNDQVSEEEWEKVFKCLLDSKILGKTWFETAANAQKKTE